MSSSSYKGAGRAYLRSPQAGSGCTTCRNLSIDERDTPSQDIRIDAFDLAESADEGYCRWCSLIYRSLLERGAELPAPGNSALVRIVAQRSRPFYLEWISQRQRRITAEIYQTDGNGPGVPELGYATQISTEITSDSVFKQISSWIQLCENEHINCLRSTSSTPRRLLDIGDPLQKAEIRTIRLIQDIQEPVKYIALSHCWGKSQNLTTTTASFESRLVAISWNDLPKTYQDAITVTRKLNLRYIWIDSLCIIQDDESDWATESSKMSKIYEDSYLTLAAALAQGDDYGFLNISQERMKHLGAPVDLSDHGINENTVWVREIHDNRTLQSYQWLGSRAWTLQENLLPRRLLTFSVTVSLECRTAQLCECGSGLFPDPFCGSQEDFQKIDRMEYMKILEGPASDQEVYEYWYKKLVTPYSTRELTKFNDRLPALFGLVSKFSLRLNDNYLAGLWKKDLIVGLAWSTDDPGRNLLDRAPSWSWASVEGPINSYQWGHRSLEMALQILDAQVTANPTGMVQKGSLRISGMMCIALLEVEPIISNEEQWIPRHNSYMYSLIRKGFEDKAHSISSADLYLGSAVKLDTPLSVKVLNTSFGGSRHSLQRSTSDPAQPTGKIFGNVLLVLLYQFYFQGLNFRGRFYLILGASSDEIGVYHRLGTLILRSGGHSQIWFGGMDKGEITIR